MTTMAAITFWHWWAIGGAMMAVELVVPGLFFLWFGAAAALIGLALLAWPDMPPVLQVVSFAMIAATSTLAWRRFKAVVAAGDRRRALDRA